MKHFYMLKVTNMATVRNFEVIAGNFNLIRICSSENYAQKWMTKL
jgi:hypothetical protein